MRRRPVLVEVLGQELARPQGERVAKVVGRTGRGSPRGRGVEVVDVDGHAALATEDDDLVVEHEVLGAHHPAGRMQRLMEVVRADRRLGLGPQLLDEDITVNPMARRERQELDDRLRLPQPPPWRRDRALDAHREAAQEGDPHRLARLTHSRMLPARRHTGNPYLPNRRAHSTSDIRGRSASLRDRWGDLPTTTGPGCVVDINGAGPARAVGLRRAGAPTDGGLDGDGPLARWL